MANEEFVIEDGWLVKYNGAGGDVVIPGEIMGIEAWAFADCTELTSIIIGDNVGAIGTEAFVGCSKLASVHIGTGVYELYARVFAGCASLTSLTVADGNHVFHSAGNCIIATTSGMLVAGCGASVIPVDGSVLSIWDFSFSDCTRLTEITIPDSVRFIGPWAFAGCAALTSLTVAVGNPTYHSAGNCIIETATGKLVAGCGASVIPVDGSVLSIGDNAFFGRSDLASISIPDGVTSIGEHAFSDCSNLTSITIPNSVASMGLFAFCGCSSMPSLAIPDSVTSIGDWTFSGCFDLTSIAIPAGVTNIGDYAFSDCSSLTLINYAGTKGRWKAIEKEDNWNNRTGDYTVHCVDGDIQKG